MKKFGKYWDENQVCVARTTYVTMFDFELSKPAPGVLIVVVDPMMVNAQEFIFVEIIPGTQLTGEFKNAHTMCTELGTSVEVNIYNGASFDFNEMGLLSCERWPLSWFGLANMPDHADDPLTAYSRAMSIIGK